MEIADLLKEKLSEKAVSSKPEDLAGFMLSNPLIKKGVSPRLVIRPGNVPDLQEVVRTANRQKSGLVPVSSARPHIRGGLCCSKQHMIVDLSSWKKIPFVDRRNRVCLIEPGVSYGELISVLKPEGMTVSMPLAPRDGKSVLAAVMDREPSTWPNKQWDIQDPLASSEFIFGNNELFRTGAGGSPGTLEAQRQSGGAQKGPLGPSQTDFQRVVQGSQGSMGIVTWITMRTEVLPVLQEPRLVGSDDLDRLISYVYEVQRPLLGEHSFIIDRTATAMLMTYDNTGSFDQVRRSLPAYICLQNIAGFDRLPKKRVEYQMIDIGEIAARHGLSLESSLGMVSARDLLLRATTPCGPEDWRHSLGGHCLSLIMLATLDQSPALIKVFEETARRYGVDSLQIGTYLQPVVQNHACHLELMAPFNPQDPDEVARMGRLEAEAVKGLNHAQAYFSRPYGTAEKIVFKNNPANTELLKKAKDIFDPNHVLQPGKFGI